MKRSALAALSVLVLFAAGCHRLQKDSWHVSTSFYSSDQVPGMDDLAFDRGDDSLECERIDTSGKYDSKLRVDFNRIPEHIAHTAAFYQATVYSGPGDLYFIPTTDRTMNAETKLFIVFGRDSRYCYFAQVRLSKDAGISEVESALRDHFWDYGKNLSLENLKPIQLTPKPYVVNFTHLGTVELPSPWINEADATADPWADSTFNFADLVEQGVQGNAFFRLRKSKDANKTLLATKPPYNFKRNLEYGVQEYENSNDRSAFVIREGDSSLLFTEQASQRLEIRFTDDLRKLALQIAKLEAGKPHTQPRQTQRPQGSP